jgi:hypothetical protein
MCALHMDRDLDNMQKPHTIHLTSAVASLMQLCTDSAQKVLRILRIMSDQDTLGTLLLLFSSIPDQPAKP